MPVWSNNQLSAITARGGSIIVSAAAGSGKTTVLVERVIRMITDPENGIAADRLLVVTYTRMAAAELKERLRAALDERVRQEPENTFLLRQQTLLSKAHISTVDSFCMSLCREYFYLLDIDYNIRIADDGELSVLRNDAMRLTLDALYTEGDKRFHALADAFASARSDSRLEDNIFKLYDFLRSHPFPDKWMEEKLGYYTDFRDVSDSVWGRIVGEYTSEAVDYMDRLNERCLDLISQDEKLNEKLLSLFTGYQGFLERLRDALSDGWDSIRAALLSFDKGRMNSPNGYKNNPLKLAVEASRKMLTDTVEKLCSLYAQDSAMCLYDIELLKDHAEQLFRAVMLFSENFSLLKKERNVADYADLEHWVLELVTDRDTRERTPIAAEIASRFDYVMVDEYQDANEVQDTIFKAVSHNEENLFVVGDVKQSIYGFRQAMPELFVGRKNNSVLYNKDNPLFPAKIILEQNYRSDKNVLAAVNFFFEKLMSPAVGDIDYNEEERLYAAAEYRAQPEPAVELAILDRDKVGEEEAAVAEARFIAERIHALIAEEYPVKDKLDGKEYYRPAVYGDFAVLMRYLSSYASVYREVFEQYGIPSHTEKTKGFLGAREIMLMTDFLRVINNPALDIELLAVMMSPVFGFDEDDLARIRVGERYASLYAAVALDAERGNEKSAAFLKELAYYRELAVTLPMYKLITVIYERSSFMSIITASDSSKAAAGNLRLLLDYARIFEQNTRRGLASFVAYLDHLVEDGSDLSSAAVFSGIDTGVELMSVHSSKGLEFPICFLANTARKFKTDSDKTMLLHSRCGYAQKRFDPVLNVSYNTLPRMALSMEIKRDEMSEELRILYVAMTRAKQKLIMVATPSSNLKKDKNDPTKPRPFAQYHISNIAKKLAGGRKISPFVVRSAGTLADWLTMCALLHPDCKALRDIAEIDTDFEHKKEFDFSAYVIDTPFDIQSADVEAPDKKEESQARPDSPLVKETEAHAAFIYPYEGLRGLPVKIAASELAHRYSDKRFERILDRPAFMSEEKLTSAEKGTALHAFMQYADFASARRDISAELDRLTSQGYLSGIQAESLDLDRAKKFTESPLVSRCLDSAEVYKEYRFNIKLPAYKVNPEVEEAFREEKLILQGAVDLAFVEDGELVIVDYKTDRVKEPSMLAGMYSAQLMLYKDALEECLGLPVKECVIYSIRHSAEVPVYMARHDTA